jgi:2'-5' RNA ligase
MAIETALLIVPSHDVQAFAAPLRERYAPLSFAQGPAHVTLFYPFVPPPDLPAAVERLARLCATVTPFEITLNRYGRFPKAIYLEPQEPAPILTLHRVLLEAFPEYPPYQGAFGTALVPHLTLAHDIEDPADVRLPPAPSFTFFVDRLHLYAGDPQLRAPWVPLAILPLGAQR